MVYNRGNGHSAYIKVNDNTAERGGGVFNEGNISFMNGDVSGNTASHGGAVLNEGVFVLSYGSITGNSADFGGGVFNDGHFSFSGGVIGHSTAVPGTVGTAVFNRGDFYMNAAAFVYEDSSVALIRTSEGFNRIEVGELNGADIAAYIEVYDEMSDSNGNFIYRQNSKAGTVLIESDSAENIALAASHLRVRDGKYTIGLSASGEILFYVKRWMIVTAVTVIILLSIIVTVLVIGIKKYNLGKMSRH